MRSKNVWMLIATLAAVMMNSSAGQTRFQRQTRRNLMEHAAVGHRDAVNDSRRRIDAHGSVGDVFESVMKGFVPFSSVSEQCTEDGTRYAEGYDNRSTWAVQMFDSSSKYPGGIFTGKVIEMGNFDQCMSVSSKQYGIVGAYVMVSIRFQPANNSAFESKYENEKHPRTVTLKTDWPTTGSDSMLWSVCVPDSCSADDVQMSVERALKSTFQERNIAVDVTVPQLMYTSKNTALGYSNGFYILCLVAVGFVLLAVVGTWYRSLMDSSKPERDKGFFEECLCSYSIIDNMNNLLDGSNSGEYTSVNGLKCLGLIQIISHHRMLLNMQTPTSNTVFYDHIYDDFWLGFLKTQVPVEIFFVMSGFLMYTLCQNRLKRGNPLKILSIIFYRIIRLWPTYITVILLFAYVLPYTSDGPIWKLMAYPEAEFCRKNWWTNLLFINTYVDSYNMCMFHSWYLACDLHYFVIGVLLTFVVKRWKKAGLSIFSVIFILSVYVPAKYIYDNKQWAFIPLTRNNGQDIRQLEHFHRVYTKSEFRFTTYLIGIAAAYVYSQIKNSNSKIVTNYGKTAYCVSCFFLMYLCMAVTGYFYLPGTSYNPWHHVLYFTFQRITYALCVSYLIVFGLLSNFDIISSLFQSQLCTVVARLSYIAYLIHELIQVIGVSQIRQPRYDNTWTLCAEIASDLAITLALSVIINLLVESPSRKIINHMKTKFFNEPGDSHDNHENGGKTVMVGQAKDPFPQFQNALNV